MNQPHTRRGRVNAHQPHRARGNAHQPHRARGKEHQPHRGEPVKVGRYTILLGGTRDLQADDLHKADILLPLTESGLDFGARYYKDPGEPAHYRGFPPMNADLDIAILAAPLIDFGGLPDDWEHFLRTRVIPLLKERKRILAFCIGSHGRTGTLLASLIAIMEPRIVDPIATARMRHCRQCVETRAQARGVFTLRGQELPEHYARSFHR